MADPFEALDGIGPERAADLRGAGFESVADLLAAGRDGLTAVDGIGPVTADRVLAAAADRGLDEQHEDVVIEPPESRPHLTAEPLLTRTPVVAEPFRPIGPLGPVGPIRLPEGDDDRPTTGTDRAPEPESEPPEPPATGSDADSATLARLAGELLRTGADERGRIGGRRLAPTDLPAELTVRLQPGSDDDRLSAAEPALFEWLDGGDDRPARFLLDPETTLAEAVPGEPVERAAFDRTGGFGSTPLRSVRVRVEGER